MKRVILAVVLGVVASAFGAQQTINVGTTANDGTGDSLRTAFTKTQGNFTDLYSHLYTPQGSATVVRVNSDGTTTYLDAAGVSNWLGVTSDSALNALAADPASNGSFAPGTWISRIKASETDAETATSDSVALTPLSGKYQFNRYAGLTPRTGIFTMRDFQRKMQQRLNGENVQINVMFIGDSWTAAPVGGALAESYVDRETRVLRDALGDAGPGYVSFTRRDYAGGSADNLNTSMTISGTWGDVTDGTGNGPNLGAVSSSQVGAIRSITLAPGQTVDAVDLLYQQKSGGGDICYRWTQGYVTGSWTTIHTDNPTTATVTAALSGVPTGGEWTLDVGCIGAGTTGITIYGVNLKNSNPGVRVHRCGMSGKRTDQYAGADATQWEAGVAALNPDLVIYLMGTNDQDFSTPANYATYIGTVVDRLRAVRSGMDVVLACPCENLVGRTTPMTSYAEAMRGVAATKRCGFLNLCDYFGPTSDYNDSSPRVLMSSGDPYHPTSLGFAQIAQIMDTFLRPNGEKCTTSRTTDPAAVNGTTFLCDFRKGTSYPSLATPTQGASILDLSGNKRDTSIKGAGSASYTGGGLDFTSATAPIWAEVPTSALSPLAASNQYLCLFYVKLPASGDWNTSGSKLFIDFSGNSNITNTSLHGMLALAQTYSGGPTLTLYRYIGTSLDSFTVANANLSPFVGTVTQIAIWRTGSEYAIQLRNASGTYKQAAASLGATNPDIGANGNYGNLGLTYDATYRPSGSQTKYKIYRCVIENLAVSGRDPAVAADADWSSVFGPN